MYYGLAEGTSVGLVFILVSITLYILYTVIMTHLFSHFSHQGLVLVYVTAILIIMARQFRRLDTIEEDINRCLVVNSQGNTKVETVR